MNLEKKRLVISEQQQNNNNGNGESSSWRSSSVPPSRKVQDYLVRMEQKVEDAARNYRLSQKLLQVATEELYDLERRHWAVLQFYNPDRAEELVEETLNEFDSTEPATRQLSERREAMEKQQQVQVQQQESTNPTQEGGGDAGTNIGGSWIT